MIITTAIIKGGAGKTTTAAALAQAAVKAGRRVLAIDLDGQGNLTTMLKGHQGDAGSSYDMIINSNASGCIIDTPMGVALSPASADLSLLQSVKGGALRLRAALERVKNDYDLIVIDTPPAIGEAALNALVASDGLLIPLEADASSAHGLGLSVDLVKQISKANPGIQILGAFITRYAGRSKVNQFLRDKIAEKATALDVPYLGEIRAGVAIKEAQLLQVNLFDHAPKSNPAVDYKKLFQKVGIL